MIGVLLLFVNVYINIKIYYYFMTIFMNLFDEFGAYGPLFLVIYSLYLLWDKHNYFFYYIVGVFINAILNLILKGIIQQPRPMEDTKMFNLALTNGKRFIFKNGLPYDIFGMPSGHAQTCIFSTTFIYLVLRQKNILSVYFIVSLITFLQRITFNHHTYLQVFVGSIVGFGFAYFMYSFAKEKIKGNIKEKPDDFGPL